MAHAPPVARMAVAKLKLWDNGSTLRISIDGPADLVTFVKENASEWTKHANINFSWVAVGAPTDVRVQVDASAAGGGQSYIGTDARGIEEGEYTMELHLPARGGKSNRTTVLHEFGHMLGLHHEHQALRGTQGGASAIFF